MRTLRVGAVALTGSRPGLFGGPVTGVVLPSTSAAPLHGAGQDATGSVVRLGTRLPELAAWALWLASPLLPALRPFEAGPVQRLPRRRRPARGRRPAGDRSVDQHPTTESAPVPGLARYDRPTAVDALRNVPVLVLARTGDATIPAAAERLARRIGTGAHLVQVPGPGHLLTLTHAGAVTSALLDLLARSRAGTDGGRAP